MPLDETQTLLWTFTAGALALAFLRLTWLERDRTADRTRLDAIREGMAADGRVWDCHRDRVNRRLYDLEVRAGLVPTYRVLTPPVRVSDQSEVKPCGD